MGGQIPKQIFLMEKYSNLSPYKGNTTEGNKKLCC